MVRRVLVFTSSSGHAHVAAGAAVAEGLRARGAEVSVVDLHGFLSTPMQWLYRRGQYTYLNNAPRLSKHLIRLTQRSKLLVQFGRWWYRLRRRDVRALLTAVDPDVVIATHPFGALAVERYGRAGLPVVELPINYEAHAMQVFSCVSTYGVAHASVAEDLLRLGVPEEKIRVTGMPLGREYDALPSRQAARAALHLPQDVPVVLITNGAMGSGLGVVPLLLNLRKRLPQNAHVVLITGHNRLVAQVVDNLGLPERVRRVGFVTDFERYLRAADVLVGKAGGMSSTSAFVAGTPLVIFGANAFEVRAAKRFVAAGAAYDAEGSIARACNLVVELLNDEKLRAQTAAAASSFVVHDGRDRLVQAVYDAGAAAPVPAKLSLRELSQAAA